MRDGFKKTSGFYILPKGFCYGKTYMAYKRDVNFPYNIPLQEDTLVQAGDYRESAAADVETNLGSVKFEDLIKIKRVKISCPKEKSKQITKNSVWEVAGDEEIWMYVTENVEYPDIFYSKVPPKTKFTVTSKKGRFVLPTWGNTNEKVVDAIMTTPDGNSEYVIVGVRFFGSLELVESGVEKFYWKLTDKNKVPIKTKRFANLGNVKSSVRTTQNFVRGDDVPEWIDGAHRTPEETFDDWKAVKYDSNDNEVEVVDLGQWFFYTAMSQYQNDA